MVIHLLVGMIASGKSTYARERADAGALVVSHDDLTAMLHARYRYESELRNCYRRMEEEIVWWGVRIGKRDVIVDRTHLTRESRRRWVEYTKKLPKGTGIVAVSFPIDSPAVHARRRFESDPRGRTYEDWLRVAQHHHAQAVAEPLDASEGFAEVRHCVYRGPTP